MGLCYENLMKSPIRYEFDLIANENGTRLKGRDNGLSIYSRHRDVEVLLAEVQKKLVRKVRFNRGLRIKRSGYIIEGNRVRCLLFPV